VSNHLRPRALLFALAALVAIAVMATPAWASSGSGLRASISLEKAAPKAKAAADCGQVDAQADEASESALASSTVCLLNRERTSRGLRSLRVNTRLSAAARRHTNDMVRRRYFAHDSSSDGTSVGRIRSTGYLSGVRSWMVGENLAWGSGTRSTPRNIVDAWMHSAGHRRNILTPRFREIGIGVAARAPGPVSAAAATYTTTFGQRG
jgi:uncharacterized protein YkwD